MVLEKNGVKKLAFAFYLNLATSFLSKDWSTLLLGF